ncbi:hypothetical protein CDAR_570721 [Caerostris darwini]|uniref:Uncharacterized protein n=1 Tax=Caerostris darwini TaxID=1538125 RepID=A0AAV4QEM3_9ARAC|nr:hypothetical protein CDAR_570721 [Caerostris darwini]
MIQLKFLTFYNVEHFEVDILEAFSVIEVLAIVYPYAWTSHIATYTDCPRRNGLRLGKKTKTISKLKGKKNESRMPNPNTLSAFRSEELSIPAEQNKQEACMPG